MKTTRYKRLIIVIVIFGVIVLAIFLKMAYVMIDDQETSSKISISEYNSLFTKEARSKLQILATTKSRNRATTSSYLYDKRFNLFVLKVVLNGDSSLENIIKYENGPSYIAMNAVYSGLPSFNFDMSIKAGKSVLVSTLHFKYSGDSIRAIQENGSLYCYYYEFKTFSINYNNEPYDIIAKSHESAMPANLAFIKKGKSLYIIIMTIASGGEEMQPDLLYKVINK